jgi:hypothetical protein
LYHRRPRFNSTDDHRLGFEDIDGADSDLDSEASDEADEDSNDEDYYRNDYPEDEDADEDMVGYRDPERGSDGSEDGDSADADGSDVDDQDRRVNRGMWSIDY